MKQGLPTLLECAVLAYCGFAAADLRWAHTPAIRYGGIAFLIWLLPLFVQLGLSWWQQRPKGYSLPLLAAAVVITLLGQLGSLNAFSYLGLALALAGLLPLAWPMLIWVPAALSWMPAFGWLMRDFALTTIHLTSIALALLGTCVMFTPALLKRH